MIDWSYNEKTGGELSLPVFALDSGSLFELTVVEFGIEAAL